MVTARELQARTSDILSLVANGETLTVTRHGTAVAVLSPAAPRKAAFLPKAAFLANFAQADPALRGELRELDQDSAELGPIE